MSEQRTDVIPVFLKSAHMNRVDWSATPLGAMESWKCGLLTSASVCLHSSTPSILCWGPQMTAIHNVAFQKAFPGLSGALGRPMEEASPEIWAAHGDALLEDVLSKKDAQPGDNLEGARRGKAALEAVVRGRFSYTPIYEGTKIAGGVFMLTPEAAPQASEAQKQEERYAIFQHFFNAILAPMSVVNIDRQYVQVNEAYTRLTGYELTDLNEKTLFDVTHPDDAAFNLFLFNKLAVGEIPSFIFEKRKQKKNGDWIWVRTYMTLVKDAEGGPAQIIALIEDIDQARKTERALKATDLEFKQILDSIPHIAWTARPDGYLDYYNQQWYAYSGFEEGYAENEALKEVFNEQRWTTILHPDDLDRCFSSWAECIRTTHPYHIEFRLADPGNPGGYRWFLTRALPIKDEDGQVVKWFGTCTDVDDLKKTEQTLRESEDRFRTLAEDVPAFVWIRGANDAVQFMNGHYRKYVGYDPSGEPYGFNNKIAALIHPDDFDLVRNLAEESRRTRTGYSVEMRLLEAATGQYNWILFKTTIRVIDGKYAGMVGTGVNINPQKETSLELEHRVAQRTAELREANRLLENSNKELEQFAYTASHDLQEPLRKIRTFGEMLATRGQSLSERDKQYVEKIVAASGRMSALIHDILRFAGTARHQDAFKPVDLNAVVRNILDDLEILIGQKEAVVAFDDLPTVQGVPIQMNQLFYNLIGNALKFAKKGVPPVVEIRCRPLSREQSARDPRLSPGLEYAEITVSDNGIGFDKQYSDKIFEMFQRLHERSSYTGTGIGLALCRKIAENHRGAISAESTPGKGSDFTVILPVGL